MALNCVNGFHECTGCMRCQSLSFEEEDDLERMRNMDEQMVTRLEELQNKFDPLFEELQETIHDLEDQVYGVPENQQSGEILKDRRRMLTELENAINHLGDMYDAIDNATICKVSETTIYTVVIDRLDGEPWVSSFDSEQKSDDFVQKVKDKLNALSIQAEVAVYTDSGAINSEHYIGWFDDVYSEPAEDEGVTGQSQQSDCLKRHAI